MSTAAASYTCPRRLLALSVPASSMSQLWSYRLEMSHHQNQRAGWPKPKMEVSKQLMEESAEREPEITQSLQVRLGQQYETYQFQFCYGQFVDWLGCDCIGFCSNGYCFLVNPLNAEPTDLGSVPGQQNGTAVIAGFRNGVCTAFSLAQYCCTPGSPITQSLTVIRFLQLFTSSGQIFSIQQTNSATQKSAIVKQPMIVSLP